MNQQEKISRSVAIKIERHRKKTGMSITQYIGKGPNVSSVYYRRWTSGNYNFTLKSLSVIAEKMNCTIQQLIS